MHNTRIGTSSTNIYIVFVLLRMRKRSKHRLSYRPPSCFFSGRHRTENKAIISTVHACVFVLCYGRPNPVPPVFFPYCASLTKQVTLESSRYRLNFDWF